MSGTPSAFTLAIGAGAVAGMRTFVMPALLCRAARTQSGEVPYASLSIRLMASRAVTGILEIAALGELIVDKLPATPDRTEPPSLAARAISGALTASALASWHGRSAGPAAVLGAACAVASAHVMVRLRKAASRRIPDPLVAAAEDAVALGLGNALVYSTLNDGLPRPGENRSRTRMTIQMPRVLVGPVR